MGLKENIKSRRTELQMTLEDLSKQVGVSRQTIQKYESGVISNIPSDKIELMAKALETTPAYLMGWGNENGISDSYHVGIKTNASTDEDYDLDIRRIQRARKKMTPEDKAKMMRILAASFDDYFEEDNFDDPD